jgi:CRP-like cAMP-binding protein
MKLEKYCQLAFFNGMSERDMNLLEPYFAPQSWVAGTAVFQQGDYAEYLYLVVKGEVVIHYKPHDGPLMTVTHVQPGGVFGWSAAMGNPTYTSAAVCALDSEVIRIRATDLRTLYEKYPDLKNIILSRLSAVIAERRKIRQGELTSMLANGLQQPASGRGGEMTETKVDPKIEIQMKALVEQLSAYTETFHGGSVEYVSFDGKKLKVRLGGACLGCPLSPSTLHGWVEGTVRQFFPDIKEVEAVD